jgi:hypothetical protein
MSTQNFPPAFSPHGDAASPTRFSTDLFTRGLSDDQEINRYRILHSLQMVKREFSHSRIYPYLSDLIAAHSHLIQILQTAQELKEYFPKSITGIDTQSQQLQYSGHRADDVSQPISEQVFELIGWSLPHIQQAIEEGKEIYEFVESSLCVEIIGVLPSYMEAGYFALPDNKNAVLHIIRFEVSLYETAEERYRAIKTMIVQTSPTGFVLPSAHTLKLAMIEKYPDIPNPTFLNIETDIDFSYQHTVYPIAKRKVMRVLFS